MIKVVSCGNGAASALAVKAGRAKQPRRWEVSLRRMGHCIRLRSEAIDEYRLVHSAVWPEVLQAVADANIRNYSIFLKEPENILFAYWEYVGEDFAADQVRLKQNEAMRRWWTICDPMQEPFETRKDGEWWSAMPEVFHTA